MKIIYCPNTPDGFDYDVWKGNALLKRFKTRKAAKKFIERKGNDIKQWEEVRKNPLPNWREVWGDRYKITRCDTEASAQKYIEKHQSEYEQELLIDIHPKDGYVVYKKQNQIVKELKG